MKQTKTSQQLVRVFNALTDGGWHTLAALGKRVNAPTQSVSARLRDLRKDKFGGNTIERRRANPTTFVYRFVD
jgi:hypothetical protein